MSIDWGLTGNVVFSGVVIVFSILVLLILLVVLMGKIMGGTQKTDSPAPPAPPAPQAPNKAAPAQSAPPAPPAGGTSNEVIAAISAAVHSVMSEEAPGVPYAITGIAPRTAGRSGTRPVWGFAGMRQNTQPF